MVRTLFQHTNNRFLIKIGDLFFKFFYNDDIFLSRWSSEIKA